MLDPRSRDLGLLLLLGVVWGHSYLFITVALESFSPLFLAAVRFDLTGLALLAVAAVRARGSLWPRGARAWTAIAVAAAFNIGLYHAFLFWGQARTTPAIAAVIVGMNPIFATVAGRFLLPTDRVRPGDWVGLILGFLGIAMLAVFRGADAFDVQGIGELAIVLGIVCWSLGSVVVKRTAHGMELIPFVAWHTLVGALGLHVASWAIERPVTYGLGTKEIASLAYLSFVASAVGLLIFYRLLASMGAMRANTVSYLSAIVAAAAAWTFLGHPVEPRLLVAFLMIATGFLLVARPTRAAPTVPSPEA